MRWTEEQYVAFQQRKAGQAKGEERPAPKPHKYKAEPTVVDGIRFDSKLEARYYRRLKLRLEQGLIRGFLRQVPFHLPGKTRLVVDFQVIDLEGRCYFVDTKGFETASFKMKLRQVHELYPWAEIRIVRKVRDP